jgi:hypothetical protein
MAFLWKYHACNVLSIRRLGYNCIVYFNRQRMDNMYHVAEGPHMRKGCRAHIWSKVVIRDDAVMASTELPPDLKAGGLYVYLFGALRLCAGRVAAGAGTAAGRAKTPGGCPGENGLLHIPLHAAGRSAPCEPPRSLAGEILKAYGGGWASPGPGLRRRPCVVRAGLKLEGGHPVLLVPNAQGEMVQGSAKGTA